MSLIIGIQSDQEKMKSTRFNRYRETPVVRYVVIGGLSYLIELCFIFAFYTMGLPDVISVGISFWIGLLVSFLLQKFITFKDHERHVKRIAKQSLSYGVLVAFNYTFTLLMVNAFSDLLGLFVIRTIALIITTIWNFVIYSRIIFKTNE